MRLVIHSSDGIAGKNYGSDITSRRSVRYAVGARLSRAQDNWIAFDELLVNNGTAVRQIALRCLRYLRRCRAEELRRLFYFHFIPFDIVHFSLQSHNVYYDLWSLSDVFKFYKVFTENYFTILTHPLRNRSKMRQNMRNRFISYRNETRFWTDMQWTIYYNLYAFVARTILLCG